MPCQLEVTFTDRLKQAMRDKDARQLEVIRAIKAKILLAKTSEGFSGEVDDALWLKTIAEYVKAMSKAREEFVKVGERAAENAERLTYEIDYLSEFLPKRLGEAETRALVEQVIASTGATSKKQMGKVMGTLMKDHKDAVDADLVRRLAESLLPA